MPSLHRKVLGIYYANAFAEGVFEGPGTRINHSCLPNVYYAYNAVTKKLVFHATRDIAVGEELSVTYLAEESFHARDERQRLLEDFGFRCECEAYAGDEQAEKVRGILRLYDRFSVDALEIGSWECAVEVGSNMAKWLEGQGNIGKAMIHW